MEQLFENAPRVYLVEAAKSTGEPPVVTLIEAFPGRIP